MKFIILNDTRNYHNGSEAVMKYIDRNIIESGHTIIQSVSGNTKLPDLDESLFEEADAVLVNGEGTMHHNLGASTYFLLAKLEEAQLLGKKTCLINSVWQDMTNDYDHVLKALDYFSVREVSSQIELERKHKVEAHQHLDLSYYAPVRKDRYGVFDLVVGQFPYGEQYRPKFARVIDIFSMDWSKIVNLLTTSNILVTGRHHEMYAACKAKCPFVIMESNTHKNSGLFKSANVNLQTIPMDSTTKDIEEAISHMSFAEFGKLFEWMDQQKPFDIGDI